MNQTIINNDKKFMKEPSLSKTETFKQNSFNYSYIQIHSSSMSKILT